MSVEKRKRKPAEKKRTVQKAGSRLNKWAGGKVRVQNVAGIREEKETVSFDEKTRDEITRGKKAVRDLGVEITDDKTARFGQSRRWPRSKGFSTGRSKMSKKLRFKKPVGKKSKITGVMTRGQQYETKRG
ncbi:MAG: hypothetical protein E3J43_06625 [Candidatus Heimdallarchaeota archaeon]|nr:MAG: hypothetical protein E3J43_06625 [Candidatus Heimdallarchaeota archaeon]